MDEKNPAPAPCCRPPSDDVKPDLSAGSISDDSATYHPLHEAGLTADLALLEGDRINLSDVDPKELRRVLWKIDLAIMPPLMLCYFFQYLDKTAIAYANLFDFQSANNLKGQDFAWLGSIFYIGYLVWQPFAA